MDYQQWLREAISQLQTSESPRRDAEILLEFVTGKGRTFILAFGETVLTEAQHQRLGTLLERRQRGEPVAHLTGVREFWSLPLFVCAGEFLDEESGGLTALAVGPPSLVLSGGPVDDSACPFHCDGRLVRSL